MSGRGRLAGGVCDWGLVSEVPLCCGVKGEIDGLGLSTGGYGPENNGVDKRGTLQSAWDKEGSNGWQSAREEGQKFGEGGVAGRGMSAGGRARHGCGPVKQTRAYRGTHLQLRTARTFCCDCRYC